MKSAIFRLRRRLRGAWHRLRCRQFLRSRVSGRIKLRGDASRIAIDPSFRCDGDLWLGVYAEEGRIVIEPGVSASGPLTITAIQPLRIGRRTLFGPNVFVTDHYHGDLRHQAHMALPPSDRPLHSPGTVDIEEDVLLGANSVVLAPARIGAKVIVAANAVVKGTVPPNSVYIGLMAHKAASARPREESNA